MSVFSGIDYGFRPTSYRILPAAALWDGLPGLRDEAAAAPVEANAFLPPLLPGESEVARITLNTPSRDAISVRAQTLGDGHYAYRVSDEYEGDHSLPDILPAGILSLGEFIQMLESTRTPWSVHGGLILGFNNGSLADSRAALRYFTTVQSLIYPQLEEHCELMFAEWVEYPETTRE